MKLADLLGTVGYPGAARTAPGDHPALLGYGLLALLLLAVAWLWGRRR